MAGLPPPTTATATASPYALPVPLKKKEDEKVDYLNNRSPKGRFTVNLSCSLSRNYLKGCDLISLKDSIKSFSSATGSFALCVMGPTEIPNQSAETIKIPTATYEFGANFIDLKIDADREGN